MNASETKSPKLLRKIGPGLILKFFVGRLTLDSVLEALSRAMGCRVGCVIIDNPRVAVDVDSMADRDLAEKILLSEEPAALD